MSHRPWRRLLVGVLVVACSALGLLAGPAFAALSMDTSTDTAVTIDEDHHWFMSAQRPISYGDYQYTAYWDNPDPIDGELYLKLTRRRLSDGNRVTIRFDTEPYVGYLEQNIQDGHNYVGLGLSPDDGTIHIVWSVHSGDRRMRYRYSDTGCMDLRQEQFTAANCDFRPASEMTEHIAEERITYPMFINDQRDRLWFTQRFDASSRGNQYLYRYDEATQRWTMLGDILRGRIEGSANNTWRFTLGAGRYEPIERSPHITQLAFDKNNRIHLGWMWREHAIGLAGQHGVNYAYSDDEGRTWYSSSGTKIGTTEGAVDSERNGDEVISIDDLAQTQVVVVEPGKHSLSGYIAVDAYNNPHIVAAESDVVTDDRSAINMRLAHYWRDTEGSWYSSFAERTEEGTPLLLQPSVFLDRQNNVYALSARNHLDWEPWNSTAGSYVYTELPLENFTWQPDGEGDGFLDIQLYSTLTCINTNGIANVALSTAGNNQIRLRMRNDTAERDIIASWITQESQTYSIARQQRFTRKLTSEDRNYTEYTLEITDSDWTGTLRQLELCTAEGVSTGSQSIDWVKITDSTGRAAKTWEFTRGFTLYGFEAAVNDNWATWERQELLPGTDIVLNDSYWAIDRQRYARDKVVNFHAIAQGSPGTEELSMREFDILGDDAAMEVRFDTDKVGWRDQRDVSSFRWTNDGGTKGITGTITGIDSQIVSATNLKIPVGETTDDNVHIRLKNSTEARRAKLYFITDADRTFNETKAIEFGITANSGYTTYDIDMSRVSGWRNNTIYQLRLDPANDGTTRRGSFYVDRIYVSDT